MDMSHKMTSLSCHWTFVGQWKCEHNKFVIVIAMTKQWESDFNTDIFTASLILPPGKPILKAALARGISLTNL